MIGIHSAFVELWHSVTRKTNKLEPGQKRVRVGEESSPSPWRGVLVFWSLGNVLCFIKVVSLKGGMRNQAFGRNLFSLACASYMYCFLCGPLPLSLHKMEMGENLNAKNKVF